jgi:hypothetical protein
MSGQRYTAEEIIEALTETKGLVYLAADRLGCTAQTVYNYIDRYPTIKTAWEAANGRMGDIAEQRLFEAVNLGTPWAVGFYLARKHKNRGYAERQEITGPDGGATEIVIRYATD